MCQKTTAACSGQQMIYLTTIGVDKTADKSSLLPNFGQSQTVGTPYSCGLVSLDQTNILICLNHRIRPVSLAIIHISKLFSLSVWCFLDSLSLLPRRLAAAHSLLSVIPGFGGLKMMLSAPSPDAPRACAVILFRKNRVN